MSPGSYLVIAKDPEFIEGVYDNLVIGSNLLGPYSGGLNDRCERIRLSYPLEQQDGNSNLEVFMVTADEVTYYEGGHMMYTHEPDFIKLSEDIREFLSD